MFKWLFSVSAARASCQAASAVECDESSNVQTYLSASECNATNKTETSNKEGISLHLITIPSKQGSCSGKFTWQLVDDCLQVTLNSGVKIPDPQTIDPTATNPNNTFFLDGNWLRERCLDEDHVDLGSRQQLYDPHYYPDLTVTGASQVLSDDGQVSDQINVVFSDGVSCLYDATMIAHELSQQRHGDIQAGLNVQFPEMFLWNNTLEMPPVYDYAALISDQTSDASPFHGLTNILVTTGLAIVINVPAQEGFCNKFGQNISTNRDTEWGQIFNVRTSADTLQEGQAAKKDLAYTGCGTESHMKMHEFFSKIIKFAPIDKILH